tara:strand:+ start:410 stop:655 length:246 start_codon:yes stop_codon:yes gene_type:complete
MEKQILQNHKNYNKLLRGISQKVKESSIEILCQGGEGYAKEIVKIFEEAYGDKYTKQSYSDLYDDIHTMVVNTYGCEIDGV